VDTTVGLGDAGPFTEHDSADYYNARLLQRIRGLLEQYRLEAGRDACLDEFLISKIAGTLAERLLAAVEYYATQYYAAGFDDDALQNVIAGARAGEGHGG